MTDTAVPSTVDIERAALAFLTPAPAAKAPSLDFLPGARRRQIHTPDGHLAAAEWGEGPTVLLLHGWEGRASDLAAFAPPLLQAGYRVLALNLPAHGESQGEHTSIPASARALLAAQHDWGGTLHAVVAHSVGTAVVVEAMAQGLQVGRVALVSPPARYVDYAHGFARQAGLSPEQTEALMQALLRLGVDTASIHTPRRARTLTTPALLVHSADDRVVPIGNAEAIAQAWAGSRLMRVDGLGHRRLLQAPEVVSEVTAFVTGA